MLGRFAGLLVCIPSFLFQNNFQKPNVWIYVWCFKSVRILSLLFFVIVCYCFFYNWNLVFGDYWHQPGCLPGEGIRSRALVLPGGQGENRWRMVGDLHGPWNGRLKHETSWNRVYIYCTICHGCIGCHGCHGKTEDTGGHTAVARLMMRTTPRRPTKRKTRQGSTSQDGGGWLT